MWTASFWKDASERAIKTAAQVFAAAYAANAAEMFSLGVVDAIKLAVASALISYLTSIASSGIGETGTASLVNRGEQ
jgi:hypothetical protein